jgi:GT2 family glycosyltransferase
LSTHPNYEIIVVDNGSKLQETAEYLTQIRGKGIRILREDYAFNFSKLINAGVSASKGDIIVVLNNDTTVISGDWLERLVAHLSDSEIGVVGALLLDGAGLVQHAGIAFGMRGLATHAFRGEQIDVIQNYFGSASSQIVSAVTFACAAFRRSLHSELGGLDESLPIGLNDVDFCLRAEKLGKNNVVDFHTVLRHLESRSRPHPTESLKGVVESIAAVFTFIRIHKDYPTSDPFFRA